jgi:hypothetical protein
MRAFKTVVVCVLALLAGLAAGRPAACGIGAQLVAVDYVYSVVPGDPPRLFVELDIYGLPPGNDHLLIPRQFGSASDIPALFRGLAAFDSRGRPLELSFDPAYTPDYLGLSFSAWRVAVPEDGRLTVKAEIVEDLRPGHAYGWIVQNHLQKDWAQWGATCSLVLVESAVKQGRIGRFRFEVPPGWDVLCSATQKDGWYVYDIWSVAFLGDYSLAREFREGDVLLKAYVNPPLRAVAYPRMEDSCRALVRTLAHAVKVYGGPPDPGQKPPLTITAVFQADGRLNEPKFQGGVASTNNVFLAFTNMFEDLSEYTVHEGLHFYNEHAFSGVPVAPSGTEIEVIWVQEGFNEYTTFKWQRDAGVISGEEFWRIMRAKQETYLKSPWRRTRSLPQAAADYTSEASFDIIYAKGALVALLFDERIRELTKGRRSGDDVLRLLYQRFNRYQGKPPYTSADVLAIMRELTGTDLTPEYERWVLGTGDLDLSKFPKLR